MSQKVSGLNSFSVESWNACGWNAAIAKNCQDNFNNVDILGISEMHLKDPNAILTGNLLKSGGDPNDRAAGVGLLLSARAQKALTFANAISPRILMARFKADRADLTVIVVYIPHQGKDQVPTYTELEQVISTVSKHDCLVVLGDFNSRLARSDALNNFMDKELVGRWSIHHRDCQGGILLRAMMQRQDLCAISTMFRPQGKTSNATWINPDSYLKPSQIDHILVCNRWRSWVRSCHVRWGASLMRWGEKKDHGTITATFSIRSRATQSKRKIDLQRLKNETCQTLYREKLHTKLQSKDISGTDVNGRWLHIKQSINEVAADTLKPVDNPLRKNGYVSDSTLELLERRIRYFKRKGNRAMADDRSFWRRLISRALKRDYRAWIEDKVRQMERADSVGDVKKVHRIAGTLQGKWKRGNTTIAKDEGGKPVTTEEERLAVFKRFYEVKFGPAPAPESPSKVVPITVLDGRDNPPVIDEGPITLKEVEHAVKCLSNEKSPGVDEIPIELIKHSPEAIGELHELINQVWTAEHTVLPDDWSQGLFVNIYKNKGSKNDPANYRPICLLCHAYKAFAIIILERIRVSIDARIKEGQEGFRNGRGCRDNLHVLRATINYALKNSTSAELIFIDFTQAFDTVSHDFLQIALEEHAIPPKFRDIIGAIYQSAKGRIKGAKGVTSDVFPIHRGVLQGCILSPILFIVCLNSIWKRTPQGEGWQIIPGWLLDELSYADDIAMIDTEKMNGERRLQTFSDIANQTASMRINIPKTVGMSIAPKIAVSKTTEEDIEAQESIFKFECTVCHSKFPTARGVSAHKRHCGKPRKSRNNQKADKIIKEQKRAAKLATQATIMLNSTAITNVDTFKYLGARIASYGGDEEEVEARTQQALQVHRALKGIWSDGKLDLAIKIRLFKVRVLSILTYGSESWKMTKKVVQKIRGFVARCFASMTYRVDSGDESPYNSRVRIKARFAEATRHIDIIAMIDKKRWQWLGHALRMKPYRNPHKALYLLDSEPGSLLSHLPTTHRQLPQARELANDRKKWKEIYENFYDVDTLSSDFVSLSMLCPSRDN